MRRSISVLIVPLVALAALSACGSDDTEGAHTDTSIPPQTLPEPTIPSPGPPRRPSPSRPVSTLSRSSRASSTTAYAATRSSTTEEGTSFFPLSSDEVEALHNRSARDTAAGSEPAGMIAAPRIKHPPAPATTSAPWWSTRRHCPIRVRQRAGQVAERRRPRVQLRLLTAAPLMHPTRPHRSTFRRSSTARPRQRTRRGRWLDDLPDIVDELADRWDLEVGPAYRGGTSGFVVVVTQGSGRPCVLKIVMPIDIDEHARVRSQCARAPPRQGPTAAPSSTRSTCRRQRWCSNVSDRTSTCSHCHSRRSSTRSRSPSATSGDLSVTTSSCRPEPTRPNGSPDTSPPRGASSDGRATAAVIDRAVTFCDHRAAPSTPHTTCSSTAMRTAGTSSSAGDGFFKFVDPEGVRSEPEHDLAVRHAGVQRTAPRRRHRRAGPRPGGAARRSAATPTRTRSRSGASSSVCPPASPASATSTTTAGWRSSRWPAAACAVCRRRQRSAVRRGGRGSWSRWPSCGSSSAGTPACRRSCSSGSASGGAEPGEVEHSGARPRFVDPVAQLDGAHRLLRRQRRFQEDDVGVVRVRMRHRNPSGPCRRWNGTGAAERTTTTSGTPKRCSSICSMSSSSDFAGASDSNTTLPDWMYVRTAEHPCGLERLPEVGHGDLVLAADVDPSQQCDVTLRRHRGLMRR